jgi:hypothetical protein
MSASRSVSTWSARSIRPSARRSTGTWPDARTAAKSSPGWPGCPPCSGGCPSTKPRRSPVFLPNAQALALSLSPLLARVAQRRRVSRWRNLAAAAAVVLIAAGSAVGAVRITQPPSGSPPGSSVAVNWDTVQATTPRTNVTAAIRYRGQPWGTQLVARVSGVKPGTTCQFYVLGAHGQRWLAGSWTAVAGGSQNEAYTESVAAPVAAVHGFEVMSGGHVLVHVNAD